MKNLNQLIFIIIFPFLCHSQIAIKDIEIPNAPALSMLNASNTLLETPKSVKALTTSLANGLGNNFAIEFTPYFFLKKNKSYYDFNGYSVKEGKYIEKSVFNDVYSNFSISVASIKKDTTTTMSVGFRTTLVKIKNRKQNDYFISADKYYKEKIYTPFYENPDIDLDDLKNNEDYIKAEKEYNKLLGNIDIIKPLFIINTAFAYSQVYQGNKYANAQKDKVSSWITMSYNNLLNPSEENNHQYFSLYVLGRFLNDNMFLDKSTNKFITKNNFDVGGKIEFEFDDLSFAYEYISRTNEADNYRSVGSIKYKLSKELLLTGGFGKNFEKNDNLVSFFGINWGLDLDKNSFSKQ